MRYLLDTNVVCDLVRNPQGKVAQRIRKVGEGEVCTSIIVAAELRYGLPRRARHGSRPSWKSCLGRLRFCLSRHRLTRHTDCCGRGLSKLAPPIGANDLLIAAQALALGYTIVTDNEKEFARVDDLLRENWLR